MHANTQPQEAAHLQSIDPREERVLEGAMGRLFQKQESIRDKEFKERFGTLNARGGNEKDEAEREARKKKAEQSNFAAAKWNDLSRGKSNKALAVNESATDAEQLHASVDMEETGFSLLQRNKTHRKIAPTKPKSLAE